MKQEMKEMKDAARSGTRPTLGRRASSKTFGRKPSSVTRQPSFVSGTAGAGAGPGLAAVGAGASAALLATIEDEPADDPFSGFVSVAALVVPAGTGIPSRGGSSKAPGAERDIMKRKDVGGDSSRA